MSSEKTELRMWFGLRGVVWCYRNIYSTTKIVEKFSNLVIIARDRSYLMALIVR